MTKNVEKFIFFIFRYLIMWLCPKPITRKIDVRWLKSSKLAPPSLKQRRFFNANFTDFSAHRTKSTPRAWLICSVLQIYNINVSIFVMY